MTGCHYVTVTVIHPSDSLSHKNPVKITTFRIDLKLRLLLKGGLAVSASAKTSKVKCKTFQGAIKFHELISRRGIATRDSQASIPSWDH